VKTERNGGKKALGRNGGKKALGRNDGKEPLDKEPTYLGRHRHYCSSRLEQRTLASAQ
jgi:hypothetical protein